MGSDPPPGARRLRPAARLHPLPPVAFAGMLALSPPELLVAFITLLFSPPPAPADGIAAGELLAPRVSALSGGKTAGPAPAATLARFALADRPERWERFDASDEMLMLESSGSCDELERSLLEERSRNRPYCCGKFAYLLHGKTLLNKSNRAKTAKHSRQRDAGFWLRPKYW